MNHAKKEEKKRKKKINNVHVFHELQTVEYCTNKSICIKPMFLFYTYGSSVTNICTLSQAKYMEPLRNGKRRMRTGVQHYIIG